MMIAVQTIPATRSTSRAPSQTAMSAWPSPSYSTNANTTMRSLEAPLATTSTASRSSSSCYYDAAKKRKRDCWEAYDYQVHMSQKMRYSLLQEQSECYYPSPAPPSFQERYEFYPSPANLSRKSHGIRSEQQQQQQHHHREQYHQEPPKRQRTSSSYLLGARRVVPVTDNDSSMGMGASTTSSSGVLSSSKDAMRRVSRHHYSYNSHKSSSSNTTTTTTTTTKKSTSSRHKRVARMTRKHYNKKKRLEMMEATANQLQAILKACRVHHSPLPIRTVQRVKYFRYKVAELDNSLRDKCNTIVQKEQDIKSWLGMTTRNKAKIISLRRRLHDRWAEVKDLQSEVKPKRQRLKNLKFAVLCEERSIMEEDVSTEI